MIELLTTLEQAEMTLDIAELRRQEESGQEMREIYLWIAHTFCPEDDIAFLPFYA